MLKLRQYFCRHDFKYLARHKSVSENLWCCPKCNVYCVQHWKLGLHYKTNDPGNMWVMEDSK